MYVHYIDVEVKAALYIFLKFKVFHYALLCASSKAFDDPSRLYTWTEEFCQQYCKREAPLTTTTRTVTRTARGDSIGSGGRTRKNIDLSKRD